MINLYSCNSCSGKYCASKISIFKGLDENQLKKITALIKRKSFEKGDILFNVGDTSDKLYIINSGKLKVYTYNKEGKEQILYLLNEGDFIGDLSLLKSSKFNFASKALEKTNICMISKEDFDKIIKESPEITLKILEYAYDRIESLENMITTLTNKDIDSRIAELLLKLEKNNIIILSINREDMANYIGVTRETISRKLTSLSEENVIELVGNKKIIIKDKGYLQDLL